MLICYRVKDKEADGSIKFRKHENWTILHQDRNLNATKIVNEKKLKLNIFNIKK